MKVACVSVLGIAMILCAGTARAQDDNAKKIVAIWELVKAGSPDGLPVGAIIEFTKDMKLSATIKMDGGDMKLTGTYKLEKDKLTVKVTIPGNDTPIEETVTIKKLTDDALEVEDKDKKVDVFKKKK
jgi:uncharacterized protein (TIGR03066 family)